MGDICHIMFYISNLMVNLVGIHQLKLIPLHLQLMLLSSTSLMPVVFGLINGENMDIPFDLLAEKDHGRFFIRSIYSDQIFSLAGGWWNGTGFDNAGSYGNYWSTAYLDSSLALNLYFDSFSLYMNSYSRRFGFSIRLHNISSSPVREPLCVTLRASKVCLI